MKEDNSQRRILIVAAVVVVLLLFCCILAGVFLLFGFAPFAAGAAIVVTPGP